MKLPYPDTIIISFDPGGRTGWSVFNVRTEAFTDKGTKILSNINAHHFGEYAGHELTEQVPRAIGLVLNWKPRGNLFVVTEDFVLMQMTGGKELLGPVRINAALEYGLWTKNVQLYYQSRSLRTSITKDRLRRWRIGPIQGKDAFAAVQHGVTFMRRLKAGSVGP